MEKQPTISLEEMCYNLFHRSYYELPIIMRGHGKLCAHAPKYFIEAMMRHLNSCGASWLSDRKKFDFYKTKFTVLGCQLSEHPKNEILFFNSGAIEPDENYIKSVKIP